MRRLLNSTVAILFLSWTHFGVAAAPSSFEIGGGIITWGKPKDEVRIGAGYRLPQFPGNDIVILFATATTNYIGATTNYTADLVKPEVEQLFEYRLRRIRDDQEVKLRPEGKKFGQPLQTSMTRRRRINRHLWHLGHPKAEPHQLALIPIDKCFWLEETGDYELEIRPRLLKWDGEKLTPVPFDPIKIKLHLTANQGQ
jgi:hypothetical protein